MASAASKVAVEHNTFPKLLLHHAERIPDRPAFRHKDLGIWQTWSWSRTAEEVMLLALGLRKLGLKHGESIAIAGENKPSLYGTFLAAQSIGAVPVPVYQDSVPEELAFVLKHADVKFAMVQNQEQVDKILSIAGKAGSIRHIIYDEPRGLENYDHKSLHSLKEVQQLARDEIAADPKVADKWREGVVKGKGSDVSVILYTSGTTGRSKGVMLSGERCIAAAMDTVKFDKLTERDEALAYLPLAWVGDHYLNFAQGLVAGFCLACPESPETTQQDLREIGPSFYFAPPRVLESLLTRVMIRMEDAGAIKQKLFHYFIGVARRHGEKLLNGEPVPLGGRLLYALGSLLIYGPLKNVLGFSNIRVAYTAGEAIGPDLFSFYRSLGMNLKQLYGQTEAFLYVTAQPDGEIWSDTVGPAMPNVELRIADNGEVQFRSPGMFVSYFKDDKKTAEAMTKDGFVKTGDAGFFDTRGHLKIIDRAKDVGKLTDGTLFAPKYIENKLKFFPNIREAVAFGNGRASCTVMLNIDLTAVGNWAERNNVVYASYQELAGHPQVYEMIRRNVDEVNRSLAAEPSLAGSQIKRFLILHKELEADDGELTRTQKVRRGFIAERYAPLIKALYDGSKSCKIETEVTFEDGRKGKIRGDVKIVDMDVHGLVSRKEAAE
ncbi:MAG: AMP-binding protein [Pseudomonadota bacterium]|nr:AMP-binding protein [Pseudomonadota bacterium]